MAEKKDVVDHPRVNDTPKLLPYYRARRYIYNLVHSDEIEGKLEPWVRGGIAVLIVLSVIAVMMETIRESYGEFQPLFHGFEVFTVIVFSIEYLLRVWSIVDAPEPAKDPESVEDGKSLDGQKSTDDQKPKSPLRIRLRYVFSFFALVDLLAILPFYLPMLIKVDLRTLRILRLLRLGRVLKLGRYSSTMRVVVRVFRNKREELLVAMTMLVLLLIVSSTLMYYLETEAQPDVFPNIPASLWWGIVTLTTIGYGDVFPITIGGKICAAVISVLSIGMVALPSGIIVSGFVEEMEEERARKEAGKPKNAPQYCPHCGEKLEGISKR